MSLEDRVLEHIKDLEHEKTKIDLSDQRLEEIEAQLRDDRKVLELLGYKNTEV